MADVGIRAQQDQTDNNEIPARVTRTQMSATESGLDVVNRNEFAQKILDGKVRAITIPFVLASSGDIFISMETGADDTVAIGDSRISAEAKVEISIIEAPTYVNGTVKSAFDVNRQTDNSTGVVFTLSPTSVAGGTILTDRTFIPAGARSTAVGGVLESNRSWVLAKSTKYIIKITDLSSSSQNGSFALSYVEGG